MIWYLGIDIGNTGISAVLFNKENQEIHPIYWLNRANENQQETSFRLPGVGFARILPGTEIDPSTTSIFVGYLAEKLAEMYPGLFVQKFKQYLQTAIPYYSPRMNSWQPLVKWSTQKHLSLYFFSRTLQELLGIFKAGKQSESVVSVAAYGLDEETFNQVINNLTGVILGYPLGWGDTYQFNLREAVLSAKLVEKPQQIFFISDGLATILSRLDEIQNGVNSDASFFKGGLVVINAGDITTEMGLVELPDNWQKLSLNNMMIHSFPYGGNSLDQDILCQLLLQDDKGRFKQEILAPLGFNLPLSELPQPGELDIEKRDRLQQLLNNSELGKILLQAATYLKLILEYKLEVPLEIDDFKWVCNRSQLQQKVILPYIKRLNRELNVLLSYTPVGTQGINQIIVTGGTSGLKEFKEWLEQKFTNAVIIQDNYKDGGLKTCSRVAHGLAILPMYPQLLERSQQQYSDYFLLWELLQVVTIKGNDLSEILQLLERRGINTRICKERILGFLDGKMPIGLIPTLNYPQLLHQSAWQNLDYQVLTGEDIFIKEEDNLYRINSIQQEHLIRYLSTLYSGTLQKISEPLILEL